MIDMLRAEVARLESALEESGGQAKAWVATHQKNLAAHDYLLQRLHDEEQASPPPSESPNGDLS